MGHEPKSSYTAEETHRYLEMAFSKGFEVGRQSVMNKPVCREDFKKSPQLEFLTLTLRYVGVAAEVTLDVVALRQMDHVAMGYEFEKTVEQLRMAIKNFGQPAVPDGAPSKDSWW
jgi:hypothetical protein